MKLGILVTLYSNAKKLRLKTDNVLNICAMFGVKKAKLFRKQLKGFYILNYVMSDRRPQLLKLRHKW